MLSALLVKILMKLVYQPFINSQINWNRLDHKNNVIHSKASVNANHTYSKLHIIRIAVYPWSPNLSELINKKRETRKRLKIIVGCLLKIINSTEE